MEIQREKLRVHRPRAKDALTTLDVQIRIIVRNYLDTVNLVFRNLRHDILNTQGKSHSRVFRGRFQATMAPGEIRRNAQDVLLLSAF